MYEDLNEIATLRFSKRREEISAHSREATREMEREYAAVSAAGVKSGPHEAAVGRSQIESAAKSIRALSDIWQDLIQRRNGQIGRSDVEFIGKKLDILAQTEKGHLHQAFSLQRMRAVVNLLTEEAGRTLQAEAAACRRDLAILARENDAFPVANNSAQRLTPVQPAVARTAERDAIAASQAPVLPADEGTGTIAGGSVPKPISVHIWSWAVIGTIIVLALGGGLTLMTSAHAQAADAFYIAAALLFVGKFLTWEETSRQAPGKKIALQSLAVLLTLVLVIAFCRWNHVINRPPTPAAPSPVSRDTPLPGGSDHSLASGQPQHPAGVQSAEPKVPEDEPQPDSPIGRAVIKFFSYRLPAAKNNGPCVPNSSYPYQCVPAAVLSQKLMEEAAKVQVVSEKYPDANPTMIDRQNFTREIQTCCWKDMVDLRYAAFDRLGPAARSKDEERAWENIALYEKSPMKTLNPRQLTSYTRYFTAWGSDLQGGQYKQ